MQPVTLSWYIFLVMASFFAVAIRMKYSHSDVARVIVLVFILVIFLFFIHKFEYLLTPFNLTISLIVFLSNSFLSYLAIKKLSHKKY